MSIKRHIVPMLTMSSILGIALALCSLSYLHSRQEYDRVREVATEAITNQSHHAHVNDKAADDPLDRRIDWDALAKINRDVVGWIYIPNTPIDYPVVQARPNNPERYLHTTFEGAVRWPNNQGTIYTDARNETYGLCSATPLLFGHYQLDGSMFTALSGNFQRKNLENHQQVYIYTPQGNVELHCFMGRIVNADSELSYANFSSLSSMRTFLEQKASDAEVVDNIPPDIEGFFTFITCSYSTWSNQRTLTYAYPVRDEREGVQQLPREDSSPS